MSKLKLKLKKAQLVITRMIFYQKQNTPNYLYLYLYTSENVCSNIR